MDTETIREAWEECDVEELEQFNSASIDPAVFKPQIDGEFKFEERPHGDLWDSITEMDGIAFMMEPLDGFLRCQAYVAPERSDISFRSYTNRIKISPADTDCTYKAFEHFINEFEANVCELEFLGGLEQME